MKKKVVSNVLYFGLIFIIPIIIILHAYKLLEVYPFGDKSLLSMDLWGQYFPMLVEQSNSTIHEKMFSWNGGLGFNSFAQSGYYCNSIFNIFLKFGKSNEQKIMILTWLMLFKFGISSLSCSAYLDYKFRKKSFGIIVASTAYSVCSYCLAYISQVMWFDSVIYLPLIILGLERLIKSNKPIFYCLILALAIYSNFYIGFSICIFLCIYFAVFMFTDSTKRSAKENLKIFRNFAVFSVIAGGLSAFVILPIYNAVNLTIASDISGPDKVKFYKSFMDYIFALFPNTKLSYEYDVPNIFTGDFVFLFIPLFFLNPGIKSKTKFRYGILLGILYLSMNLNVLDYVWHGFHFPNQLPGRWTFMFSFVCVLILCEYFINIDSSSIKDVIIAFGMSSFFIYLARYTENKRYKDSDAKAMIINTLIYASLLCVYFMIKFVFTNKDNASKYAEKSAIIIGMCPIFLLSFFIVNNLYGNTGTVMSNYTRVSSIEGYVSTDVVKKYIKEYENDSSDFYRMELNAPFTFDSPQLYGYKGITYYSSTMTGSSFNFFKSIGYRVYANNVSTVYNPSSPILNSFFSIKYIINRNEAWSAPGLSQIEKEENYQVLSNDYYLPLAFRVSDDMTNLELDSKKPLENQNKIVSSAMGEDIEIFERLSLEQPDIQNGSIDSDDSDWNNYYYHSNNSEEPTIFSYSYTCEKDGFVYMQHNFRSGKIEAETKDGAIGVDIGSEKFKNLGYFNKGDSIKITVTTEKVFTGLYGMELYLFDSDKMQYVTDTLSKDSFNVTNFRADKITGNIDMSEDGFVYTSIPNDNGWKVICDGKKIDYSIISDTLIGFNLPSGSHNIVFKYSVPGLSTGIFISVVCLIIVLAYELFQIYKRKFYKF